MIKELAKMTEELEQGTKGLCDNSTQTCTACACQYGNSAVEVTQNKLLDQIQQATEEARDLCEDPKVKDRISELFADMVIPWTALNKWNVTVKNYNNSGNACDIIDMWSLFEENAEEDIGVNCTVLHVCGSTIIHNSKLTISTKNIFIGMGAHLEQAAPGKAIGGSIGPEGTEGENGAEGEEGRGIQLLVTGSLLTGSNNQFQVTLQGGDGGDGGAGGSGKPGV